MNASKWIRAAAGAALAACLACGCREKPTSPPPRSTDRQRQTPPPAKPEGQPAPAAGVWTAEKVAVVEKMDVPESVVVDPASGAAYVSNVEAGANQYWTKDGKGFVARLEPGGKLRTLRWRTSMPEFPLHAPKGMCLMKGSLYVADVDRVVRFVLGTQIAAEVDGVAGKQLNDMATDGETAYVSDTGAGKVLAIRERKTTEVKAPKAVNGITFFRGRMFAVSWGLHEVYELDPTGKGAPKPFGVAGHFKTLDGIEVLDDGTFVVSDFDGHKVCTIAPDRKTVRTLVEIETPADIGLDRQRSLLYVPQFMHKKVAVFKLQKK